MMTVHYATPESCGVSSAHIEEYIRRLEQYHLAMHDILIARGNNILTEIYYPPFEAGRPHRLYSVTKSFVAIAVGFALQDGLLSLDDPMSKFFQKELAAQGNENNRPIGLHMQTVRNMLMMSTAKTAQNWFDARCDDRVQQYFNNTNPARNPGETFEYDSSGTFVLGALVERLTGKTLMEYLREKLFDQIGISDKPFALSCPGGHTWGDSAFLMPPTDLFRVARFIMNGGTWDGKPILSTDYVRDATSCIISTGNGGHIDEQGYGYYIWKAYGAGFFFNGMGCQYALCVPEKDLILVCNADNQGNQNAKHIILDSFYEIIVANTRDSLPDNPNARKSLADYVSSLKLFAAYGSPSSPLVDAISGKIYVLSENRMGISWLSLTFNGGGGIMRYENAQGEKELGFGICSNVFGDFPQKGYSDLVGGVPGNRLLYGAYSAAWKNDTTLWLKIQIIDHYFGNMDAVFAFASDGRTFDLTMTKAAEDFLDEYHGTAKGTLSP